MEWSVLFAFMRQRVQEPDLWGLVVGVGLLIFLYGQIIVPWLRKVDPLATLREEIRARPKLVLLSVFVAFLFPFVVSVLSSVVTSYATREVYDRANFPDEKPDPVFRVDTDGAFVDMGRSTRELLDAHPADDAAAILGDAAWADVVAAHESGEPHSEDIFVSYGGDWYLVSQSPSADGLLINIYLARLVGSPDAPCRPG